MEPLFSRFEYISDVSDEIDRLVEQASRSKDRTEKKKLLAEARELISAYEKHTGKKVFNQI